MNVDETAKRWKKEYGVKKARTMAKVMENQARASGEPENVIQRWKEVGYLIGGKA